MEGNYLMSRLCNRTEVQTVRNYRYTVMHFITLLIRLQRKQMRRVETVNAPQWGLDVMKA